MKGLLLGLVAAQLALMAAVSARAEESALGAPPEVFVRQAKSWASTGNGIVYATCKISPKDHPDRLEAYLLLPRAQKDGQVIFLSTRWKGRPLVNGLSFVLEDGALKFMDMASGGLGLEDFMERTAKALLAGDLRLSYSLADVIAQQPRKTCKLPPSIYDSGPR
jgi:hypothetical protein